VHRIWLTGEAHAPGTAQRLTEREQSSISSLQLHKTKFFFFFPHPPLASTSQRSRTSPSRQPKVLEVLGWVWALPGFCFGDAEGNALGTTWKLKSPVTKNRGATSRDV
jgi:hypothetical protein